jgi:hypothetical protein
MKYETDLKNLRKNLNLKKFIKTLEPQDFDNQKQIYLDLLQSCSSKKKNADQMEDEYDKNGFNEYLDDLMVGGKFFSTISDNFKLEMDVCVEGEKGLDEFTSYFLISSKVNKTFYVIIYISEHDGNDGFYVQKKFKLKNPAQNLIKKLSDQQRKFVNSMNKMNKD